MLVAKLELWRFGDPKNKVDLGTMYIANIGGSHIYGDYHFKLDRPEALLVESSAANYLRAKGAWELLKQAISRTLKVEKKHAARND